MLARRDTVRAIDEQREAEGGDDRSKDDELRGELTRSKEADLVGKETVASVESGESVESVRISESKFGEWRRTSAMPVTVRVRV